MAPKIKSGIKIFILRKSEYRLVWKDLYI